VSLEHTGYGDASPNKRAEGVAQEGSHGTAVWPDRHRHDLAVLAINAHAHVLPNQRRAPIPAARQQSLSILLAHHLRSSAIGSARKSPISIFFLRLVAYAVLEISGD
jgi:hypothetical protein